MEPLGSVCLDSAVLSGGTSAENYFVLAVLLPFPLLSSFIAVPVGFLSRDGRKLSTVIVKIRKCGDVTAESLNPVTLSPDYLSCCISCVCHRHHLFVASFPGCDILSVIAVTFGP